MPAVPDCISPESKPAIPKKIFIYTFTDFVINIAGLVLFVSDVVLDIWAVVTFYQEQAYISMGVLIFLLLGSSTLLQAFSWHWYKYSSDEERRGLGKYTYLEKYLNNRPFLGVLHVCHLGVIFRSAGVMEISLHNLMDRNPVKEGIAVYLTHDLTMLRLFETFAENAPQLTLMIAIISHRENVEWVTGLKTLASFAAIAFRVLAYHRSMRAFSINKTRQLTWISSFVYFLWNLFLIIPRVAAVAISASVLPPGMIAVHFVCLWFMLFLWAWRQKTDFMEHPVWEWFYRAIVALILYYSWFNVSDGNSRRKSIVYHSFIAADITLLLMLWWWKSDTDASIFGMSAQGVFIVMGASYTLGILGKVVYYQWFHPKHDEVDDDIAPACIELIESGKDEVDFSPPPQPPPRALTASEKRMQKMAGHFFS